jgi:hypothetical protein
MDILRAVQNVPVIGIGERTSIGAGPESVSNNGN